MGEYKLKGVISEIKVENNKYQVKITGTTGYTVKYDKDDKNNYNLFIPESIKTDFEDAIIVKQDYFFNHELDNSLIPFVINCYTNHKPIEVIIKKDILSSNSIPPTTTVSYKVISITALSN